MQDEASPHPALCLRAVYDQGRNQEEPDEDVRGLITSCISLSAALGRAGWPDQKDLVEPIPERSRGHDDHPAAPTSILSAVTRHACATHTTKRK